MHFVLAMLVVAMLIAFVPRISLFWSINSQCV
jgi:nitrogen fixation-related uncharacterized protein